MKSLRWLAPVLMAIACPGFLGVAAAATNDVAVRYKDSPGLYQVEIIRDDWTDAKRDRKVPVKIYFPKSGEGPFPVVIFSHGLGGSREGYEYLGRHWASHGYVSVHLQHPGSDDAVWRNAALAGKMGVMRKAAADPRNAINRPLDVSFALDQLEKLNREKLPLQKRLDLDRIGVAGHSFGAYTALAIAGETFLPRGGKENSLADPRVKAAIPMSAPVSSNRPRLDAAFAKIKIPCLHLLQELAKRETVTLMCHCDEDEPHCHRHVLRRILEGKV